MNELKIFNNEEFGEVRTIIVDGKPYFIGSDIAKALGYKRPNDAINQHCRATVKYSTPISGKMQDINYIPEGDVYRLIMKSQLPSAEHFEKWVFDEVLPSIRKNGGYISNQENLSSEQILANAVLLAQNVIAEKDKKILEMQPKAMFFDAVADSRDAVEMASVAKILAIPGYGRNNLFEFLREVKVLQSNNQPYQKFVDMGLFRVLEQKYIKPDGSTHVNIKTLVYQKGVAYINKLIQNDIHEKVS